MKTELHLIYGLIESLKDNEYNNDERMEEEYLRDLLNIYRVDSLRKYSSNGISLSGEVFQNVDLYPVLQNTNEATIELPKMIRTNKNYGFYIEKNGVPIPILESETYHLSSKGFSKSLPRAKTEQNTLTLFLGDITPLSGIEAGSENYTMVQSFREDLQTIAQAMGFDRPVVKVNLKAVLFDPRDSENYNWETDIYPFPAERLQELMAQLRYSEFGEVFKKKNKDEVQNTREDHIRYHDNTDINQNKSDE